MSHTELRSVSKLVVADRVELSEDVRLFRVVSIEGDDVASDARRKVSLQSMDGTTRIMLMRTGRELVRVVVVDN